MKNLAKIFLIGAILIAIVGCNKNDGDSSDSLSCEPVMDIRAFEGVAKSFDIDCDTGLATYYSIEDNPVGVDLDENLDKITVASTVAAGIYNFTVTVRNLLDGHEEVIAVTLEVVAP